MVYHRVVVKFWWNVYIKLLTEKLALKKRSGAVVTIFHKHAFFIPYYKVYVLQTRIYIFTWLTLMNRGLFSR